jgi:hypothetical protein
MERFYSPGRGANAHDGKRGISHRKVATMRRVRPALYDGVGPGTVNCIKSGGMGWLPYHAAGCARSYGLVSQSAKGTPGSRDATITALSFSEQIMFEPSGWNAGASADQIPSSDFYCHRGETETIAGRGVRSDIKVTVASVHEISRILRHQTTILACRATVPPDGETKVADVFVGHSETIS